MTQFLQTSLNGFVVGSLYALIALGYTMVYGILKFINFAHGDVFALGVHLAISIAALLGVGALVGGAPPPVYVGIGVLVLTMFACGLFGYCIERLAYRPLRHAPRLNVLITAIGVSLLLQNAGQLPAFSEPVEIPFSPYPRATPRLLDDATLTTIAGVPIKLVDVAVVGLALAIMIGLQYLVFSTKFGLAMRAVSFHPRNAGLMGINVDRVISLTFVVGSMLAAAAGVLYTLKYSGQAKQTADALWVMLGLKAFVAAVVGGIGNIRGALLGGLLIGLTEFYGVNYLSSNYRDAYVFAILILVLLVRPQGLLGNTAVEKV
jgi:branched-chain amino acid transport system permease protein